jgi:serine protease Do
MSEEYNRTIRQDSSGENGTQGTAVPGSGADQVQDQAKHQAEQNQAVHRQSAQDQGAAAGNQTAGGTTYSWVNPKLHQNTAQNGQAAQGTGNPWNTGQAGNWQNGRNYQYSSWQTGDPAAQGGRKARRKKEKARKPKKPMTAGKKWMVNVAAALVFGLVAGTVFYGVNLAGDQITGRNETAAELTPSPIASTDTAGGADSSATSSSEAPVGTVESVTANAMPSLVTISTMSVQEMQSFFGGTQQYEAEGAGTGVIVGQNDTELLIATNNHVVSGANSLSVGFIDETSVEGEIKGTDPGSDLAVVSVKLDDISDETMSAIKIATLGDSDDLALGEQVVAIGNALGMGQSVTSGYVSALNRDVTLSDGTGSSFTSTGLIQIDAPINSGNSGGALLNMQGELIGINEAKSSMTSSGVTVDGVGYAIPIAKAEPILETMMSRDKVSDEQAAYLGVTCADVSSQISQMYNMPEGVCFTSVVEGGPAEKAGAKQGDVLTEFDGREISGYQSLQDVLQYYPAGETVDMVVQRSDEGVYKEVTLTVTLGSADEMPEELQTNS